MRLLCARPAALDVVNLQLYPCASIHFLFPLFLPLFLCLSPLPITTSSCSPAAHPVLSFPPFQNTSSSTSSPHSLSLPLPPSLRLCLALNLLRPRTLPAVWRRLGSISQQKLEHVPAADSRLILQQQHQLQLIVAFNANNLAQLATCETQSKEAVRRRIGRPLGDCSKCRGSRGSRRDCREQPGLVIIFSQCVALPGVCSSR